MLTRLTSNLRFRAAAVLAVAYASCVVVPPLALAFADGAVAAHCVTEDTHAANVHVHEDGSAHTRSDDAVPEQSGDNPHETNVGPCCGLFCFPAVTGDIGDIAAQPFIGHAILPVLQAKLSGQGPDRIKRPPKSLLSL